MCLFVCLFRCTPAGGQEISSLLTVLPPHHAPSSPCSLLTVLPPHRAPSSPRSLLTTLPPHRAPSSPHSLLTVLPPHMQPVLLEPLSTMGSKKTGLSPLTGKRHGGSKKTGCSPTPHRAPSSPCSLLTTLPPHMQPVLLEPLSTMGSHAGMAYLFDSFFDFNELQINKLISIFQSTTKKKNTKKK